VATPSFHISAIAPVCLQSFLGATLVFPPELTAESLLQTIGKENVNTVLLPPHALGILQSLIRQSDSAFSSLKRLLSGGTRVPENVIKSGESPDFEEVQAYGATELNGIISIWNPKMGLDKIHTVGKTHLFPEIKILDPETKKELPPGETGEVAIRGPQLFTGYWKKPEETKKLFIKDGS
jgi:acyl-CoA synthetase (AMP-forming)/AMP-acid ligase II